MKYIFKFVCIIQVLTCALCASFPGKDDFRDDVLYAVAPTDVTFRLYTPESPTNFISLQTGQLSGVTLDITRPFKFIIHGWSDNAGKQWVIDMKNANLKKGAYNVIAVDWSRVASQLYPTAAADTKDVGKFVALLVADLHNTLGVAYTNVHLIGHSLGAHISGFCGQSLLASENTLVARITGMDPAGPLFFGVAADSRLSQGDAVYVDVIHTDGNELGYYDACGNIDFYVNGGTPLQPGCLTRSSGTPFADIPPIACSHVRAYLVYIESINSVGFISNKCGSYFSYLLGYCKNAQRAVMGDSVDQTLSGVYYLTTNLFSPYARNGRI